MNEQNLELVEIPAKLLTLYGKAFPFDIYLKFDSGKAIKLSHKEDDVIEIFKKYQEKGVTHIFVQKDEFKAFINDLKKKNEQKIFDPDTLPEEKVDILSASHQVMKEAFKELGINETSIDMAKTLSNQSLRTIQDYPNIFNFFEKFKNNCSDEFMNFMLTSYISTTMLETFAWFSSSIKEKNSLGTILTDILLSEEDIKLLRNSRNNSNASLPDHILEHPSKMADLLKKSLVTEVNTKEVLDIVLHHHESPDSSGFPEGLDAKAITLLPAIYIVATHFIDFMIKYNFDYRKKEIILSLMYQKYKKGNYRQAYDALCKLLKIT